MRNNTVSSLIVFAMCLAVAATVEAREYHVSGNGDDANDGSASGMLRTVSAAARLAQPGDTITVHEGVYRERVTPPRGGTSDSERIVYRAAPGEHVEIKGSEVVTGWEKVQNATWKVTVPNALFGGYNPFADPIHGDWFNPKGRDHHTGAVYLDGHWLIEAANRDEVLAPVDTIPPWLNKANEDFLLNVAWLQPKNGSAERIGATGFAAKNGTQNAPCSEGGECIGFILDGHWVRYESLDFGDRTEALEIRAASAANGGIIEVRLGTPDGDLLGSCTVPNTGGWQSWASYVVKLKPVGGVKSLCLVFRSLRRASIEANPGLWFAEAGEDATTIWAQFDGIDPNEHLVEINARRTVFYPQEPFVNYITVRGFALRHAATQWAPPTAEQIGLIGTHWSKGWVIEDNDIAYSVCTGITLGKYGDQWDNTSADSAEGYVETIKRALENGWNKETVGSHMVRNNTISHCEQAGIVGSMGAAFCTVTGNTIHDIHVRGLFGGAEMAGLKFHGAVDSVIEGNRIYRCTRGLWLDWMAQGTRVTRNLFHDNPGEDLFVEVNHGPFLVDNNIFHSACALLDWSQGGAYAHNLFGGRIERLPELGRETPFLDAHGTGVAGLHNIPGGDNRFFNNVFAASEGLAAYDSAPYVTYAIGNVELPDAALWGDAGEAPAPSPNCPGSRLARRDDGVYLECALDPAWGTRLRHALVTTELLGKARIPDLPYEDPDGTPIRVEGDYFGTPRNQENPFPGPFAFAGEPRREFRVWPLPSAD